MSASALPNGYAMRRTREGRKTGAGKRKLKKVLRETLMHTRVIPRDHMRKDMVGISGSSMLLTLARTSAYGESSSSSAASMSVSLQDMVTSWEPSSRAEALESKETRLSRAGDRTDELLELAVVGRTT